MSIDPQPHADSGQQRQDRVIIAAAIAALFGRPAAVRHIRAVPGHGPEAWTREGRLAVHRAHGMPAPLIRHAPDRGEGSL